MVPLTLDILLVAVCATALLIALAVLYERWKIKHSTNKWLVHYGPSSQFWYSYKTHTPSKEFENYLVTDGLNYWTCTYEDAIGTFEPLDWTVTHFTPIFEPGKEWQMTVTKDSAIPHERPPLVI